MNIKLVNNAVRLKIAREKLGNKVMAEANMVLKYGEEVNKMLKAMTNDEITEFYKRIK